MKRNHPLPGLALLPAIFLLTVALILSHLDPPALAQADIGQAVFKPPDWKHGMVINFGIYNRAMLRIGSSAFKIVLDPDAGLNNYTIRYNARSDDMAEASTVVIDKKSLLPVKSSRKLNIRSTNYYYDAAYGEDGIDLKYKRDNGSVVDEFIPVGATDQLYDVEELVLIIPQIIWDSREKVYFYVFIASRRSMSWVLVEDLGNTTISWKERIWKCRKLYIKSDLGAQYMYTTIVDGRTQIAKYDAGLFTFINLDLPSTGKVSDLEGEISLGAAMEMAAAPQH